MVTAAAEASRRWRSRNPGRVKELNDSRDRDKLNALSRDYYRRHADELRAGARERGRVRYHADPQAAIAAAATYRKDNLAKVQTRLRQWRKERLATDAAFRVSVNLRRRLNHALRGTRKSGSAIRDLGCSVIELKLWLEGQFVPGMTWDNYGPVWHVDHKKSLASFDLADREQLLAAVHYTNLQPMFARDNIVKGG